MADASSLKQLYLTRLREFFRQPSRIFWVYGFPTVLAVVLGIAFNNRMPEPTQVTVVDGPGSEPIKAALDRTESRSERPGRPPITYRSLHRAEAIRLLDTGDTPLVVEPGPDGSVTYRYDPTRPESSLARAAVDDALQRAANRVDPLTVKEETETKPGNRYIDWLIPGLIGLNAMGGGLWGVGFLIVNMRIGKLLKRFAATPMPRRNFLLAILGARLTFLLPDVLVLLALGVFAFHMPVRGNAFLIGLVVVMGALAFAGIGLLIASRTQTTETVSGLMNLVMIPMWLLSGVFFSSSRYPAAMQGLIQALPLTQLATALREVILKGAGLVEVAPALLILAAWALVTFLLALRWFRWS
jgi:ABC-type multidrug transport system permease subunit